VNKKTEALGKEPAKMSVFERYLSIWVGLCIVVGVVLGHFLPGPVQALGEMKIAEVNLPVAVLIWLMIIPMLLKVDFGIIISQISTATGRFTSAIFISPRACTGPGRK
jgi:ACR3 family arsenite transporter